MVEYGNGISQVAGQSVGGHAGGQSIDLGASVAQFVSSSAHTISAMPPGYLVAGIVVIVLGFIMLKRAF